MRIDLNNISLQGLEREDKDPESRQQGSERAQRRGQDQPVRRYAKHLLARSSGDGGAADPAGQSRSAAAVDPERRVQGWSRRRSRRRFWIATSANQFLEHIIKVSSFGNRAKAAEDNANVDPSAGVAEIRELCVQFQRAIAALASNDVAELETSTAAQDGLVEKLQSWFRGQPSGQQPSIKVSPSDFRELAHLTRVYSSLLQSALRTTRLRAAFARPTSRHFPAESEPAAASGWSCEA